MIWHLNAYQKLVRMHQMAIQCISEVNLNIWDNPPWVCQWSHLDLTETVFDAGTTLSFKIRQSLGTRWLECLDKSVQQTGICNQNILNDEPTVNWVGGVVSPPRTTISKTSFDLSDKFPARTWCLNLGFVKLRIVVHFKINTRLKIVCKTILS
jgi:hypothetical protein